MKSRVLVPWEVQPKIAEVVKITEVSNLAREICANAGISLADLISGGMLLIAIVALCWNAQSVRRQAAASDFNSYLLLTERFSMAWRKFREAEQEEQRNFEFGDLLNLLEGTCHLYNKGLLNGATREMVKNYLSEVIPKIFQDEYAINIMKNSYSGPDTFSNIRRFARINKLEGVPHQ